MTTQDVEDARKVCVSLGLFALSADKGVSFAFQLLVVSDSREVYCLPDDSVLCC